MEGEKEKERLKVQRNEVIWLRFYLLFENPYLFKSAFQAVMLEIWLLYLKQLILGCCSDKICVDMTNGFAQCMLK